MSVALRDIIELRSQGMTLAQVGAALGITKAGVQARLKRIPKCRQCKLPVSLVPGRRLCKSCFAAMMAQRPSKLAKATGYRKSPAAHKRSYLVRAAREGKTLTVAARSLGISPQYAHTLVTQMRGKGKDVPFKRRISPLASPLCPSPTRGERKI